MTWFNWRWSTTTCPCVPELTEAISDWMTIREKLEQSRRARLERSMRLGPWKFVKTHQMSKKEVEKIEKGE
jgi:hypothetical protein